MRDYAASLLPMVVDGQSSTFDIVSGELHGALESLTGRDFVLSRPPPPKPQLVVGTRESSSTIRSIFAAGELAPLGTDGFVIRQPLIEGRRVTIVAANTVPTTSDEWVTIYPHHERLVVFNSISNPDVALRGIPVMDRSGNMVGTFSHMSVLHNGMSQALITLKDNKTVAVADQHLRIDPTANIVVADLSYGQMDSMPAQS